MQGNASTAPVTASATTNYSSVAPPKAPSWRVEPPQVDVMDGSKRQYISTEYLGSDLELCFENGRPCSVSVAVRAPGHCVVESNISGEFHERSVRLKFDDEKAIKQSWGIADNRKAIFPHSQRAFIASLKKHKTLWVEFGCDRDDNDTVFFDIDGLEVVLHSAGL
jgi:hypothetical protein